jgi:hypothetical protein
MRKGQFDIAIGNVVVFFTGEKQESCNEKRKKQMKSFFNQNVWFSMVLFKIGQLSVFADQKFAKLINQTDGSQFFPD